MRLLKLTIQNFMSIRYAEVNLANQGLVLLQGVNQDSPAFDSNGAGKSSIFEALTYVLFEKTIRGLAGKEVVNREVGKNMVLYLDLEGDDGKKYRIARYRNHREHKNNTYIYQNGVNITPKSSKDCNTFIEKLFQLDYMTFVNSILFGQGLIKTFSVASDSEKKAILEKMLNLDIYSRCQDVAKAKLKQEKSVLDEINSEVLKQKTLLEEIESNLEQLKKAEEEETKRIESELKTLNQELKDTQEELEKHNSDTSEQEQQLKVLTSGKEKLEQKLEKYKEYEKYKNELEGKIYILNKEIEGANREIERLRKEYKKIKKGIGKNCPVCGQEIKENVMEESLKHIESQAIEHKSIIQKAEESIKEHQTLLEKIQQKLEKKGEIEKNLSEVQEAIFELRSFIKTKAQMEQRLKKEIQTIQKRIAELENKKGNAYKLLIEKKEQQKVEILDEISTLEEKKEKLLDRINKLEFAVEAYGNAGIKSYLLDAVTPFLNKKANEYLSKLSGNTAEIEFSTVTRLANGELRDKFEVRINNQVGGDSYKSNSTGERRRIDLAISLALQDLVMTRSNARLNILLYDEVFDGVDAVGCENVILLLQEMSKKVESIFVITHNDILKTYFDKYLVVTKKNGQTTVSQEEE